MKGGERRIFRALALAAAALAAVAFFGLVQQGRLDHRRSQAAVAERAGSIADDLREQLREAGAGAEARRAVLASAIGKRLERLEEPPMGAFEWEPKNAVVWKAGVPEPLVAELSRRTRWLDWTAPGRRSSPRRSLVEVTGGDGVGYFVLWGRVDSRLYALVFARAPVNGDFSWWLWALLALGVVGAAAAVIWAAVALSRAAEQARLNDELKTRFVSDVSHELKTPLAAMGLWADLLRSGRLPSEERRQHALEVVAEEKNRMLRMVERLLTFSRLEEHRRVYRIEQVELGEVARMAGELFKGDFAEGGLQVTAPPGMVACCDRDAVKEILDNLLGNAVKYAAADGPVAVEVRRVSQPVAAKGGGEWIQVQVADHGPGIPEAWRQRVFERFRRGNGGESRAKGGFGLGLSISRQLAREMEGELSVHSRADGEQGALFILELPALA